MAVILISFFYTSRSRLSAFLFQFLSVFLPVLEAKSTCFTLTCTYPELEKQGGLLELMTSVIVPLSEISVVHLDYLKIGWIS